MADQARPKHRSPSYPSIDLATAIQRTEELWRHGQRHFVPMADAMRQWNYSPKSSGGLLTVAALKKYGLLDDQGSGASRQVRVSDAGRAIVTDEPTSERRAELIRQAALRPRIHQELWDGFVQDGGFPPESALRWHLVNERAFSESAARDLIAEFRQTLDFAGLTDGSDTVSLSYQDSEETPMSAVAPPAPRPAAPHQATPVTAQPTGLGIHLPLGPGELATLSGPFPVTEEQWELITSVLDAMKPGLVAPRRTEQPEPQP